MIRFAEKVARGIIPDLAGMPLYIAKAQPNSLVTTEMLCGNLGCYVKDFDLVMQPELESTGDWRGRGVAVIIDNDSIAARAANNDDHRRIITGVLIHELCHWADTPAPTTDNEPDPRELYSGFVRARANPPKPLPIPAAFWSHGKNFTRLAAHCWYRSNHGGGLCLRPDRLVFGNVYPTLESLSAPIAYCNALHSEFEPLAQLPLREISIAKPPAEFSELWQRDQNRIWEAAREKVAA